MSTSYTSISSDKLSRLIDPPNAPTLVDTRAEEDLAADPCFIPGATRRLRPGDPSYSPRNKRLVNQSAADHTIALAGGRPVLLDMYEHAYQADFGAAAARYVDIYMEAIRWDNASTLYDQYARES